MPTRRAFLVATTLGLGVLGACQRAEVSKRIARVGVVSQYGAAGHPGLAGFEQELRERGWVDGRNIIFERRFAYGDGSRLPEFMSELVALEVDVIFTILANAAIAAKKATDRIPIVFSVGDAVGRGIVANLARPEANATGVSDPPRGAPKGMEFLRQIAPGISRVVVLSALVLADSQVTPEPFEILPGIKIFTVDFSRGPDDLAWALAVAKHRADAIVAGQATLPQVQAKIVEALARLRLPTLFTTRPYVELGGLLSYGFDFAGKFRRAAVFVDKILRGAKPADLPVELPMVFDLAINLKTARSLGLTVPREILVRADRIVE